ncbi:hypothetical protein E6O75_ATG04120 [Venturia nashicola]|uniref:Uncharacterized protein n=1 Tax=Venturia nashicola TaxID=86259 RepID=A0A4Z1P8U1_9PEZI|nr:hypothetical protein E6O75_ATG04120 [Venturia nashicola]
MPEVLIVLKPSVPWFATAYGQGQAHVDVQPACFIQSHQPAQGNSFSLHKATPSACTRQLLQPAQGDSFSLHKATPSELALAKRKLKKQIANGEGRRAVLKPIQDPAWQAYRFGFSPSVTCLYRPSLAAGLLLTQSWGHKLPSSSRNCLAQENKNHQAWKVSQGLMPDQGLMPATIRHLLV